MAAYVCLFVVLTASALMPSAAADGDARHGYTIANGVVRYSPLGGVDIGGYKFPSNGHRPTRVNVDDLTGTDTPFVACQDTNDDGECGGGGEPRAVGCGDVFLAGFDRSRPVSVLVSLVSIPTTEPDCGTAFGTTGIITVTYDS